MLIISCEFTVLNCSWICKNTIKMSSNIVRTLLRDVKPEELGFTLPHEHLNMDFTHFYRRPPSRLNEKFNGKIELSNVGYVKQYPYSSKYNLILNDQDAIGAVFNDLRDYKRCGGGTIVENSTYGLDRKTDFLMMVTQNYGGICKVVFGTGYYIADTQTRDFVIMDTEELYDCMRNEMTNMIAQYGSSKLRAGVIGEIASGWPIKDFERNAIRAAAELQQELKCGVSFHPHRTPEAPFEIMRLYLEAGGAADKAVMSHLDRTLLDEDKLLEFAQLGTYCQHDLFGVEVSHYQLNVTTDMPSDAQRLDRMKLLANEGKVDRLLMSHDIHTKHRLIEFGGHGYSHILNNVLPVMKTKGFSKDDIKQITEKNPADWLAMSPN